MKYRGKNFSIVFNKPHLTGRELTYIKKAYQLGQLSGGGYFTKKCHEWMENNLKCNRALICNSCSTALEMMAILSKVGPKDEVIMPSFTFVTTANAFVLRGATPIFVDIKKSTLNINEDLIESAITKNTKAIVAMHYAGVGCEMDKIQQIAKKHKLIVLEDAAQAILAKYKGKNLGTISDLAAISFHETKNVIAGEGGALIINEDKFIERAEIIREKGTDRSKFLRGMVDKYTWVDIGSSYLPSELTAAFLFAQLEKARTVTKKRINIWNTYHKSFELLEKEGDVTRPNVPIYCKHNGHAYYLLTQNNKQRIGLINHLKKRDILSVFHYIPLHSSPAGKKYGRYQGDMKNTNHIADTIVRLPMYFDLTASQIKFVVDSVYDFYKK